MFIFVVILTMFHLLCPAGVSAFVLINHHRTEHFIQSVDAYGTSHIFSLVYSPLSCLSVSFTEANSMIFLHYPSQGLNLQLPGNKICFNQLVIIEMHIIMVILHLKNPDIKDLELFCSFYS